MLTASNPLDEAGVLNGGLARALLTRRSVVGLTLFGRVDRSRSPSGQGGACVMERAVVRSSVAADRSGLAINCAVPALGPMPE